MNHDYILFNSKAENPAYEVKHLENTLGELEIHVIKNCLVWLQDFSCILRGLYNSEK